MVFGLVWASEGDVVDGCVLVEAFCLNLNERGLAALAICCSTGKERGRRARVQAADGSRTCKEAAARWPCSSRAHQVFKVGWVALPSMMSDRPLCCRDEERRAAWKLRAREPAIEASV